MKYLSLISLILLLLSCNKIEKKQDNCIKVLEKTIRIKIPYNCTLIEHNSDFAIGDYTERFKLKLSENDFNKVLNLIDSSELKRANDMDLYYMNINNVKGDFISIIFNPIEFTIKYTLNSE